MLQAKQGGEVCPSATGSLSLGLRPEHTAVASQQAMAMVPVAEMEHPQDMARQALAATGGKSNLKATKWLLERRAEVVQQQHLESDMVSEPGQGQQREGSNGDGAAGGHMIGHDEDEDEDDDADADADEDEELAALLPSSVSVWGNNNISSHAGDARVSAFDGALAAADGASVMVVKRANSLPSSMDWLASSIALERHASVGSSSPFCREDIAEAQLQLKLQPALEQQEPVKTFKVSRSPEPDEIGKMNISKPAAARPTAVAAESLQDAGNLKRKRQDEADTAIVKPLPSTPATASPISVGLKQQTQPSGKTLASLAERMRPNSIAEILGQDHLLRPHCVLRSLLDGESLPCIIFGGPPGTGKTSLARLIARSASCRFVALSSAKGGNFEIQEILDEAKQARKFGQRTVLFVETLNRFSKSQQECLLPAIEAGYVVFIGATTESPSAELVSSLLLQCRIFTLRKLQHDHLCTAMKRAISDHERGVQVSLGDVVGIEVLAIENEVIQFLATAADGDARVALNALEAAVYIALGKMQHKRKLELDGKVTVATEVDDISHKDREKPVGNTSISKRDTPHNVLEHLKGYFQFSQEEYAKPFKKIVGGREVTYGISRDKEHQKLSSDLDKEGGCAGSTAVREGIDTDFVERKVGTGDFVAKSTTQVDFETALVVTMLDAREAFQWPQMFIEKTQEESDADVLSVMLKSIRGGDSNASVYWLARMLEKSEDPLRIASTLTKFASDEIGMADPQALVQAVACHQACQLLGGKECCSFLTQCVVYLSMAPKSDALVQAFQSAQKVVQDGQNEPVPSHLRCASGGFAKELCFLPASLRNFTFLRWPEL